MSFAFRADGRAEQDAQAVLLKRPAPGPRLRHLQASLGMGESIMLDRDGRTAPIQWDLMTQWIRDALSTDAEEDSEAMGGFDTAANVAAMSASEAGGQS